LGCRYIMGRSIENAMHMERFLDGEWRTFNYHTNQLETIATLTEWDDGKETETITELYAEDVRRQLLAIMRPIRSDLRNT